MIIPNVPGFEPATYCLQSRPYDTTYWLIKDSSFTFLILQVHLLQNNGSVCLHSEHPNSTVPVSGFFNVFYKITKVLFHL